MENPGIVRLTPQEVKGRFDPGDPFVLVDVRKELVYTRGHLPGALCLLMTDLEDQLDDLPAGKSFIFYGT